MKAVSRLFMLFAALSVTLQGQSIRPTINGPLVSTQTKIRAKVHTLGEWRLQIKKAGGPEASEVSAVTAQATADNQGQIEFDLAKMTEDKRDELKKLEPRFEGRLLATLAVRIVRFISEKQDPDPTGRSDAYEVKENAVRILLHSPKEGDQVVVGAVVGDADQVRVEVYDASGKMITFGAAAVTAATAADPQQTFTAGLRQRLAAGNTVRAIALKDGAESGATSDYALVETAVFDWGRLRAYFAAGTSLATQDVKHTDATTQAVTYSRDLTSAGYSLSFVTDVNWYSRLRDRYAQSCPRPARILEDMGQLQDLVDHWDGNDFNGKSKVYGLQEAADSLDSATDKPGAIQKFGDRVLNVTDALNKALLRTLESLGSSLNHPDCLSAQKAQFQLLENAANSLGSGLLARVLPDVFDAAGKVRSGTMLNSAEANAGLKKINTIMGSIDKALEEFEAADPNQPGDGFLFNSSFEARLGQSPVAGAGNAPDVQQIFQSPNSAVVGLEVYTPYWPRFMSWKFDGRENALFIAPIAKGSLMFARNEAADTTKVHRNLYASRSVGIRFGHFLLDPRRKTVSPELLSYLDVTVGRFANFSAPSEKDLPVRTEFRGYFKVPSTPLSVGFTSNVGYGPDDTSFFFGTRIDLSKLMSKVLPKP